LLLSTAAASIQKLCADPKWLGAQPALMGVLHTWTRAMLYHPHAHFLVSAGALSADGQRWISAKHANFLVPVRALSVIFRAKLRERLKRAGLLEQVPAKVWKQKWVVHAQHAGSGQKVLDYLGRYVFRIAISNSRLERLEQGQVTFRYRDNRTQQLKRVGLPVQEFVPRFLQHVLPKGLTKVRHYGLSSSACCQRHAAALRLLQIASPPTSSDPASAPANQHRLQPSEQMARCPHCGTGRLVWLGQIWPSRKIPP
jgi:putative transposase